MPRSTVCLTFDFDALSVWLAYDEATPAMLARGEYGARVGVPRVLDLVASHSLDVTFFVPGHTVESFRIYVAGRVKASGDIGRMRSKFNGKFWWDMTEARAPAIPGRLRGPGWPGPADHPLRGAFRPERPRHPDDPADAERATGGDGGRPRSDRRSFDASAAPVEFEAGNYIREG